MKGKKAFLAGVCALALGCGVHAQAVPPQQHAAAATDAIAGIGDIVVTAQRRDESLSRTPVSVAVVTADQLAKSNIVSEQDLRTVTPGLSVRAGLNSNGLNYSLRGQSQDPYSSTRPGVLPYFNEVQVGGAGGVAASSSAFYDLQSVQVLKGPQGTLFGRSATGGAILFTSRNPGEELNGYASALAGDYDALKFEGAVGGPLDSAGVIKVRVAGVYQKRDGFQKNLFDDSTVGGFKRRGARGTLVIEPSSNLKNETVFDYLKSSGSNTTAILSGLMPFTGAPPPYVPVTLLYGGSQTEAAIAAGAATLQAFTGVDAATARAQYTAFFAGRENQSLTNLLAQQAARGPYKVDYDGPNLYSSKNKVVTNATTYELGSNIRLRNIFGYVDIDAINGVDADGTPFTLSQSIGPSFITQNSRQLSDELQLQGTALDGRLEFITGGYFSDERMTQEQQSHSFDIFFGGADQTYNFRMKNKTLAAYSQATYDLNGRGLALTVGGRYTSERVEKDVLPLDSSYATPGIVHDQHRNFNAFSWTVGLKDQFSSQLLGYIVSRRSYKSGGFNGTMPAIPGVDQFASERVTDVEAGVKFNGHAAGVPVHANIALYYDWTKNSQRTGYALLGAGPASLTVNVPAGQIYGLEFDGQIQPVEWFELGGTFNYTHAAYSNKLTNLLGVGAPYDQVTDTPKISGSVYGEASAPISDALKASIRGEVYGQSKSFTSPLSRNNFGTVIKGYDLVNLRAGISSTRSGWSLFANVKNLLNKTYYVGGQATGEVYQLNLLVPGDRRTFTVELRFNF